MGGRVERGAVMRERRSWLNWRERMWGGIGRVCAVAKAARRVKIV